MDAVAAWFSNVIAGVALVVSVLTAVAALAARRRDQRTASLTAYFHWNQQLARTNPKDPSVGAGYNLVIWNQGPASATDVELTVHTPEGELVELATVEQGEFPLRRIDNAGRYPVQFAPASAEHCNSDERIVRRFHVRLTWTDGNGRHRHELPLRRGQVRT